MGQRRKMDPVSNGLVPSHEAVCGICIVKAPFPGLGGVRRGRRRSRLGGGRPTGPMAPGVVALPV